jgi:stage V sporulation protein SpoVS
MQGSFAEAGNPHGNLDIIKVTDQGEGGTSASYLAARLKKAGRDDLLDQIGPGKEHHSVRSAAIAAGIIKPVPTVRLVADMSKVAAAIHKHLDPQQVASLVEELQR